MRCAGTPGSWYLGFYEAPRPPCGGHICSFECSECLSTLFLVGIVPTPRECADEIRGHSYSSWFRGSIDCVSGILGQSITINCRVFSLALQLQWNMILFVSLRYNPCPRQGTTISTIGDAMNPISTFPCIVSAPLSSVSDDDRPLPIRVGIRVSFDSLARHGRDDRFFSTRLKGKERENSSRNYRPRRYRQEKGTVASTSLVRSEIQFPGPHRSSPIKSIPFFVPLLHPFFWCISSSFYSTATSAQ